MRTIIKHLKTTTTSALSSVIPDCCNIGVIYRVLLASNVACFCGFWVVSVTFGKATIDFLNFAPLLETLAILSLIMLCGIRKIALVQLFPAWLQRLICGVIPALIAAALAALLGQLDWLDMQFVNQINAQLIGIAALFGLVFQHYFELRNKVFSPALDEAKLQVLQARIRPHFLFNSINAVLSLIRTEPRRAETTLEDLADLFRVLMRDTRVMTSLAEEIQLCRQYLSIEKIRLGERLQVQWTMPEVALLNTEQIQIATLMLQPLIENAVHHGVEPSESASLIDIHIGQQNDKIKVEISNPFHAKHITSGNRFALSNIRQRLTLLYDVEADFSAQVEGDKFVVKLRFPLQKMAEKSNQNHPNF